MILTIDIGTTSMKGGLITPEGRLFSYHRVIFPNQFLDRDPLHWKNAFYEIAHKLQHNNISAVVISGNGPTLIPFDENIDPIPPLLFWKDPPKKKLPACLSYYLPKVADFQINNRDNYNKCKILLSPSEWIVFLLTGSLVMVTPHEEFTPYIWTKEDIDLYDLNRNIFPPIVEMGEIIGKITEKGTFFSGLKQGIPVIAAGSDFIMSLIGTNTMTPGKVCDRAGSSEGINYCSTKPVHNDSLRILPHAVKGLYNISAILPSTGLLFEQYKTYTNQDHISYDKILTEILSSDIQLDSPVYIPESSTDFSLTAFKGLQKDHTDRDIGKGLLETIGFKVREGIETIERTDASINEICLSGGQCKNKNWNRMKADITGKTFLVPEIPDAELVGGACTAVKALERDSSLGDIAERMCRIKYRVEPDLKKHKLYDEKFNRYLTCFPA